MKRATCIAGARGSSGHRLKGRVDTIHLSGRQLNKLHEERDAIVVFKKWVMLSTVRKVQTKAKDMVDVGMDER